MKHIALFISFFLMFSVYGQDLRLGIPSGKHNSNFTISHNYSLIASTGNDNSIQIWDVNSAKILYKLYGHEDKISSVRFSSNDSLIISCSSDKTAKVWSVKTGELLHNFEYHKKTVEDVQITDDGKHLITISWDNTSCIWDLETGTLKYRLNGHKKSIRAMDISPDDSKLVTVSRDKSVIIWDIKTGKLLHKLKGHKASIKCVAFSPDGNTIASADNVGGLKLWDSNTGKRKNNLVGHLNLIGDLDFNIDGSLLVSASRDKTSRVWDVASGKNLAVIKNVVEVNTSQLLPGDSLVLFTKNTGETTLYSLQTNKSRSVYNSGVLYNHDKPICNYNTNHLLLYIGNGTMGFIDLESGKLKTVFNGSTSVLTKATYDSKHKKVFTSNTEGFLFGYDLKNGLVQNKIISNGSIENFSINTDTSKILFDGYFNQIFINDLISDKQLFDKKGLHSWGTLDLSFRPNSNQFLVTGHNKKMILYDYSSGEINKIRGRDGFRIFEFNPDGNKLLFAVNTFRIDFYRKPSYLVVKNIHSGKQIQLKGHIGKILAIGFSPAGKYCFSAANDSAVIIWNPQDATIQNKFVLNKLPIAGAFSSSENYLAIACNDNKILVFDQKLNKQINAFNPNCSQIISVEYIKNDSQILCASKDGSWLILDANSGDLIIQNFTFNNNPESWVHITQSGQFDASPDAMELMYWVKGTEIIEFEQLKDRYWVPGLWEMIMKGEELPSVQGLNDLKMYPEIELGTLNDNVLPITIRKRDGGYGKIALYVNGREVSDDIRDTTFNPELAMQTIYYTISDTRFLRNGENKFVVNASSENGFVKGPGEEQIGFFEQVTSYEPQIFGVIIGVSDYLNPSINLNYTVKDAEVIQQSFKMAAKNLVPEENVHIYSINSTSEKRPNKNNIKAIFEDIETKATPDDLIFVYMSGHGITWGPDDESQFYFLTADAVSSSKSGFDDPTVRSNTAISTTEWTDWMKEIRALRQVMIIDACGSGKAVDNLIASRDIGTSQIKALDKMKDRVGMWLISGCAADKSSFEHPLFDHGLLTYALLQGMKGGIDLPNGHVYIEDIFDYAGETVPELAEQIGKRQVPQMLKPKGASFPIGILNEENQAEIPLSEQKQIFTRSTFINTETYEDDLNLTSLVDEELSLGSSRGSESQYVFLDTKTYSDACKISGGYTTSNGSITLELRIRCGSEIATHTITGSNPEAVVKEILKLVQ